jgi:hypothetical protein
MDHALSPFQPALDDVVHAGDAHGRWLRRGRNALSLLRRAVRGSRQRDLVLPLAATLPMPVLEPPDLNSLIGELLYPGCSGAVVRLAAEMLGTELMAAYPWSREHGWTARN